jgi:hypothetical protein
LSRRNPFKRLWGSEQGLSAMLVFLCLALFVGTPVAALWGKGTGQILFDLFFSLLLVFGVVTVAGKPIFTIVVSGLTLTALALRWLAEAKSLSALWPWGQALGIILLGIFTALVLVQVFQEGPITRYRIQGSIVVYLMAGLMWAAAYGMLVRGIPGAFAFANDRPLQGGGLDHRMIYYSFITLTTIGYGDITPVHPFARSLAMAEGLVGQLYPAILIARLVSMELETRRRK